jgi:ethanolamine ammonia-lyase large subunit
LPPTAPPTRGGPLALADLPLATFLHEALVPYEADEVTRLIIDSHDAAAFAPVAHLTVGGFRDWLLGEAASHPGTGRAGTGPDARDGGRGQQADAQPGPDAVARKVPRGHALSQHLGLPGHLAVRLQPNHPTDSPAASRPASSTA